MKKNNFSDILDAAGSLSVDEREELIQILHKRTIEERRAELLRDIKNARTEYKKRKYSVSSPEDIMNEILS